MRILYKLETLFPICEEWERAGTLTSDERNRIFKPPTPDIGISKALTYGDVLHEVIHEHFCPESARIKFIGPNLARTEKGVLVISDAMFRYRTDILDPHDARKCVLAPWSLAEDMPLIDVTSSAYDDDLGQFRRLLGWLDDEEEVKGKIKREIRAEVQPQQVRDAIYRRAALVFEHLQKYPIYPR